MTGFSPRRDLTTILATTFLAWMGQRMTAVALPLVALAATGSPWTTGLVGGAAGLPVLTSGWWARGLRHRVTSCRAIAATLGVQVAGLLVVPVAGALHRVDAEVLVVSGLVSGAASALAGPGTLAVISAVADRIDGTAAAHALIWNDLSHRISMIVAPPLAALAVVRLGPGPLLWTESAGVALAALLLARVGAPPTTPPADLGPRPRASLRAVLARHPQIRLAVVMDGVGGSVWFAFSLGLAVLGAADGHPGTLVSAAMTGYGLGSVGGALVAPAVVPRLPTLPTIRAAWILLGAAFVALPFCAPALVPVALVSACGGAAMPIGIGALNAMIVASTTGSERLDAFAADAVVHDGAVCLGLLVGGALIGLVGTAQVLVAAGVLQVVVALATCAPAVAGRRPARTAPTPSPAGSLSSSAPSAGAR